ncbi:MAG: DUF559 domain-containing protein [Desulfovibrionaceae bacterium]|nr:DUF559 domain-containing protein [Desulfovibrionaceae bacterium]
MDNISLLNLILSVLLIFFFLKWQKEKKHSQSKYLQQQFRVQTSVEHPIQKTKQPILTPEEKEAKDREDYEAKEKEFIAMHNPGPFHCDGKACNPKHRCLPQERWMCRDVIYPIIPREAIHGQYQFKLPYSGSRRADFAIKMPGGQRIVVELDGYTYHAKEVDKNKFNINLLRQNELTLEGWTVLRFSFDQMKENSGQCREILKQATLMEPRKLRFINS